LRDRGQLAQFHEVSRDKQNWVGAATLNELFGDRSVSVPGEEVDGSRNADSTVSWTQEWFYKSATGTPGPLRADQIAALVTSGQIVRDTLIWKEGLPCWLPLRDVPEFAGLSAALPGSPGAAAHSASSGIGSGPATQAGRVRASRSLMVLGGASLFVLLGALALILADKYRKGELHLSDVAQPSYINSHMSSDIPQATGLVVSGATVTDLKSGALIEVPGSRGTCFALNPKGYLLTNKHVVEEYVKLSRADAKIEEVLKVSSCRIQPNLWVYFAKEKYDAKVVYISGRYDLAVLKVDREGPYFRLTSRPDIVQGTRIYAMGFPAASSEALSIEGAIQRSTRRLSENVESVLDEADYRYSITDGIVSLLRTELGTEYIQHSAPISGGNSGGPLIYDDGSVLGINTLVAFDKEKAGVGVKYYALSLRQALDEIKRKVPEVFPK
jgi:S1-C subfamily serine protease